MAKTFRQEVEEIQSKKSCSEVFCLLGISNGNVVTLCAKCRTDRICEAAVRMGERMDNTPLMGIEIPTILPDNWFSRREGAALERDSFRANIAKETEG